MSITLCQSCSLSRTHACVQYTTTWDRKSLFAYTNLGSNPVNFGKPGATGQADIVINDNTGYQSIWGHGGALSMSVNAYHGFHAFMALYSRLLRLSPHLYEGMPLFSHSKLPSLTCVVLQNNNPTNYWSLLNYLFDREPV